jgi:hypothetical protein
MLGALFLAACGSAGGESTAQNGIAKLTAGPPAAASLKIRDCLNAHGYQDQFGTKPPGENAPDAVVFFRRDGSKGSAGEIGIYATTDEANRKLVGIKSDAKASGVIVVPQGLATVIYYAVPDATTRADVSRCLADANAA